jgi:hypothetical protein
VSPPRAPAHGFRTVHIPCATSIVKANITFAFSSSHFALRLPLLPQCSSPAVPPARAARKLNLPVAKLDAPLSCCCMTRAHLTAPSARPCEPVLAAASSVRAVHRSVSESLISTLSAELASVELVHAPRSQTAVAALPRLAACAPRPHVLRTSAHPVFDEVAERDVVSCYSIISVYMFSRENHGAGLVLLASQFRSSCCCACSLALLLAAPC